MEHLDRRTALRWGAVAVAGGLAAAVSGCSSDPNSVADQARSGDRKGYVAGDGSIEQLPATDRGEPVSRVSSRAPSPSTALVAKQDTAAPTRAPEPDAPSPIATPSATRRGGR